MQRVKSASTPRKMEEFRTHVTENMAKQFADIQDWLQLIFHVSCEGRL